MISSAKYRYLISFTSPSLLIHPFSLYISNVCLTVKPGWDFTWVEAFEWLSICIDMLHTPSSAPMRPVTDSLSQLNALTYTHFSILLLLILPRLATAFCLEDLFFPLISALMYSIHPSSVLHNLSECSSFSSRSFERPPVIFCHGLALFFCFSIAFLLSMCLNL